MQIVKNKLEINKKTVNKFEVKLLSIIVIIKYNN